MTFLDSTFWWHLVKTAAIDVCCLAVLAFAAHCFVRRAGRQRTVWQITVICLLVLPAWECTGFGTATAQFMFNKQIVPGAAAEYVSPISKSQIVQQKLILPTTPARRAIWWPCWVWMCGVTVILGRMAAAQALLVVLRLRREKIASRSLQERVSRVATSVGLPVAQIERTDADILQFPKGTTLTGRKIRLGSGDNLLFEFLPIVQTDGFSISITATLSMKIGGKTEAWNIPTFRNMTDGTTLPIESPRLKYIIVFISPRIIDSAGKPMHSDAELSRH
jgi:hypothetical protein